MSEKRWKQNGKKTRDHYRKYDDLKVREKRPSRRSEEQALLRQLRDL
ncbi:MAG: hypothetical protein N2235_01410 [Fischerella sp.]|nr:hypothetical protein [Fischerella sp.]